MELAKTFEGLSERYSNLVLFMPIYQLNQMKHPKYKEYDLMEIGFGVLLYMIDQMLGGQGYITPQQLNQFLKQVLREIYNQSLSEDEIDQFRKYLIDDKLRNGGYPFQYEFTDYPSTEKKVVHFDLIESEQKYENAKNNGIRIRLTQKGIELLFKTKEMFAEMQISITMLYFKQQLEKGAFQHALTAVRDILFQIDSGIRSIGELEEKIKRNILSAFNRQDVENQFRKQYQQTKQEKKQFKDLRDLVDQVKLNYTSGRLNAKQKAAFETILEIDNLLNRAMSRHEILFTRKFETLQTITGSIQLVIENAFSKHFHFEQEILQAWIEKWINQEKIHQFFRPLIPVKTPMYFHPFRAFSSQITRKKIAQSKDLAIEITEEEVLKQKEEQEKARKKEYQLELEMMKIILLPLLSRKQYLISDILKELRKNNFQDYSKIEEEYQQHFLNVSIALHRCNHRKFEIVDADELTFHPDEVKMLANLTREYDELENIGEFEIYSIDKKIEFANGTQLLDFLIKRKDVEE